jgi:hypothetical protein
LRQAPATEELKTFQRTHRRVIDAGCQEKADEAPVTFDDRNTLAQAVDRPIENVAVAEVKETE